MKKIVCLALLLSAPAFANEVKSKPFNKDECTLACGKKDDFAFTVYKKEDLKKQGVALPTKNNETCSADIVKKLKAEACTPCYLMCNPAS